MMAVLLPQDNHGQPSERTTKQMIQTMLFLQYNYKSYGTHALFTNILKHAYPPVNSSAVVADNQLISITICLTNFGFPVDIEKAVIIAYFLIISKV